MRKMRYETARSLEPQPVRQEVTIRTLSVSLLAVAAIAASLVLTRNREATGSTSSDAASTDAQSANRELDAIRAAGL
jgi:hypothetical protein